MHILHVLLLTGGAMVLDCISGFVSSIARNAFSSKVMRHGLYSKIGSACIICLSYILEGAQSYVDLGTQLPIFSVVCGYVIIMESGSIIENVGKVNKHFKDKKNISDLLK